MAGRAVLVESDIPMSGTARMQVNRQPVRRRSELAQALNVTVFAPNDLDLVQGGPAGRREYLDDVLVGCHARLDAARSRRSIASSGNGARCCARPVVGPTAPSPPPSMCGTPGWATQARPWPPNARPWPPSAPPTPRRPTSGWRGCPSPSRSRTGGRGPGRCSTRRSDARPDDVRRQVTSVGPHRDDLDLGIGPRPARTHASQGEQRCVALALRLASHGLRRGDLAESPVLLLDDVFSELDPHRAAALVDLLPPGQVLLTTAVEPPSLVRADQVVEVSGGRLTGLGPDRDRCSRRGEPDGDAVTPPPGPRGPATPGDRPDAPRVATGAVGRARGWCASATPSVPWPASWARGGPTWSGWCSDSGTTSSGRLSPRTSAPCAWTA